MNTIEYGPAYFKYSLIFKGILARVTRRHSKISRLEHILSVRIQVAYSRVRPEWSQVWSTNMLEFVKFSAFLFLIWSSFFIDKTKLYRFCCRICKGFLTKLNIFDWILTVRRVFLSILDETKHFRLNIIAYVAFSSVMRGVFWRILDESWSMNTSQILQQTNAMHAKD